MPSISRGSFDYSNEKYFCVYGRVHVKTGACVLTWIFLLLSMISALLAPFGLILSQQPGKLLLSIVIIVHLLGYITASIIALSGIIKGIAIRLVPLIIFDILDIFITVVTAVGLGLDKLGVASDERYLIFIGLPWPILLQTWKIVNLVNCYTYLQDSKPHLVGYAIRSGASTPRIPTKDIVSPSFIPV